MRLVYVDTEIPVEVGDEILRSDDTLTVTYFRPPHKPSSSGKVSVKSSKGWTAEYFVGVIGAEWIEREDRL